MPSTTAFTSVYDVGEEPDPRFSLANERTFLAWIRTALALTAAGVAAGALPLPIHSAPQLISSALFVVAGCVCAGHAHLSWRRTERALRLRRPLPRQSVANTAMLLCVVAAALTLAVGAWLR